MYLRKILTLCLIVFFIFAQNYPVYAYSAIPEFLCQLGIAFYKQGDYAQALHEFNKALIISPDCSLAQKYIRLIESLQQPQIEEVIAPSAGAEVKLPSAISRDTAVRNALDRVEGKISPVVPRLQEPSLPAPLTLRAPRKTEKELKPSIPTVLTLDEKLKDIRFPVEIQKDKTMILRGQNITRFLATQPDILKIEKINENELRVTGFDYGYTYVHVWDSKGRWTIEFLGTPPKPEGPTIEEEMRLAEEKAGAFKLRYSLDYSTQELGRRIYNLKRTSYSWNHWLALNGQTPYGDLDSQAGVTTVPTSTDLNYFTLGLENGRLGSLNDFAIRTFDFTPNISNLAFSSPNLRGIMLDSPAFNKKLDYKVFWGREGGGRYGGLSPGLNEIRDSFLSGLKLDLTPTEKQLYSFSVFNGYGSDRQENLHPYGYDFQLTQAFNAWKFGYEIGYDSEKFAHLVNTTYSVSNFRINSEFRETDKNFQSMTGGGWRAGEIGLLTNIDYRPSKNLDFSSRLDVFQDRLFPNPEHENRLNEDLSFNAGYTIDDWTNLRFDYSLQNDLGRLSPMRSHNAGIGLYRTFDLIKRINSYVTYRYQKSQNFTAHTNDFINNKVIFGFRTNLIGYLYYYANKELNWLDSVYSGVHSQPSAFETGLDYNNQLFKSPFYANFRLTYRVEKDTESPVSFLSGEDYWETYAELTYRFNPDFEAYCSTRIRNVWGDNPNISKRMDASFYAGLRYTWDTGIHWNPIGTIEGVAFKDYNYDGLKQKDEPIVEGIKVWLGKNRFQITNQQGKFRFTSIKARKAFINIDTTTIPSGFVLTTPANQEVTLSHGGISMVNFGLASRTEITGIIFEDTNSNNEFDLKDKGVKGIVLTLEDGSKVTSGDSGRYILRKPTIGKHTLKLELNSLPSQYIPAVPILKEIELTEGSSYVYNIPLKKIQE